MAIGQLNPTQLSSRLAAMSDQQLQQYAALHQDDPYVLAIAMDVKNQRDAARQNAMVPPQQAQPTVVQQLIARMAQLPPMQGGQGQQMPPQQLAQPPQPQQPAPQPQAPAPTQTAADGGLMSGIAQLPARNLQRMKEGGIAGYNGEEESLVSATADPTLQSIFAQKDEQARSLADTYKQAQTALASITQSGDAQKIKQYADQTQERLNALNAFLAENYGNNAPNVLNRLLSTSTPSKATMMAAYRDVNRPPRFDVPPAPRSPARSRAPAPAPAPAPATPQGGVADLMGPPAPSRVDRLLADYKPATATELINQAQTIAEPWNKEVETANKPFREQFAAERARLQKGEDQNKWQALMQAGLAMMASRSPYALQALGEGGLRGLQMYQDAQQRDAAARKALMQSEMILAQAERAERSGNRREAVQLVQAGQAERKAALQFGLQAEQIRNSDEYNKGILNVQQGLLKVQEGRLGVERGKANLLGQGAADAAKARAEYGKLQIAVMRNLEKDPEYQLADPVKKQQMATTRLRTEMMNNPFLASYAAGIGFSTAPTGKVRTLTENED